MFSSPNAESNHSSKNPIMKHPPPSNSSRPASTWTTNSLRHTPTDAMLPNETSERSKTTSSPVCTASTKTSRSTYGIDDSSYIQALLLALKLLRGSRINPRLSKHAQLHGAFDYNRTPRAPCGTLLLVHEKSSVPGTRSPHAVDGWYLGPATNKHYRWYRFWTLESSADRFTEILASFPTYVALSTAFSIDLAIAAARDIFHAVEHPSPA